MALVDVARFHTLSEAEVAASLLRSAGIPVSLSDTHYGSVFWIEQKALGGFRLSVPEQDLADSVALLDVPPAGPDPEDEQPAAATADAGAGRATLAVALTLLIAPAGWLVAGRRRSGRSMGEIATGTAMALAGLVAGSLVILAAYKLLADPP